MTEGERAAFDEGARAMRESLFSYAAGIAARYQKEVGLKYDNRRIWTSELKATHWRILAQAVLDQPIPAPTFAEQIEMRKP